jgi:hypothetical protein
MKKCALYAAFLMAVCGLQVGPNQAIERGQFRLANSNENSGRCAGVEL